MGVGDRDSAKLLGDRLTLSWMDPLPATHTVQPQTGLTNALGANNGFYFIFYLWEAKGIPKGPERPLSKDKPQDARCH